MRLFLSARLWATFGVLAVLGLVTFGMYSFISGGVSTSSDSRSLHNVDVIAAVTGAQLDEGWQVDSGKTVGNITLTLDDGRIMAIVDGTPSEVTCTNFADPYACVLLADTLGTAVIWFAYVPADEKNGKQMLTLPALVDMQAGGDLGVLQNDWVIKLANGVDRTCESETATLREFITKYSSSSISILDLLADEITEVICNSQ
jgi:hypothetical protein